MADEFLASQTTKSLFVNCSRAKRSEFLQVFRDEQPLMSTIARNILAQEEPYSIREDELEVSEDDKLLMYNMIKENDVDLLRNLVENSSTIRGIGNLFFDFEDSDEEVLNQLDEKKVPVTILNPLILCIKCRSFQCLKYLIEKFGLRSSI